VSPQWVWLWSSCEAASLSKPQFLVYKMGELIVPALEDWCGDQNRTCDTQSSWDALSPILRVFRILINLSFIQLPEVGTVISSILEMKKLIPWEVESVAPGPAAGKQQSWDLPERVTTVLCCFSKGKIVIIVLIFKQKVSPLWASYSLLDCKMGRVNPFCFQNCHMD